MKQKLITLVVATMVAVLAAMARATEPYQTSDALRLQIGTPAGGEPPLADLSRGLVNASNGLVLRGDFLNEDLAQVLTGGTSGLLKSTGTNIVPAVSGGIGTGSNACDYMPPDGGNIGLSYSPALINASNALYNTGGNIRISMWGDSFICNEIYDWQALLTQMFGLRGYGLGVVNGFPTPGSGATSLSGQYGTGSFAKWMNGSYFSVPANGSVVFDIDSDTPILSNTFQVFYLAEPEACTFTVQVAPATFSTVFSTITTGYIPLGGTFSAQGTSEAGAVVTGTAPLNTYQLKVTCLTGTLNLIGAEMVNSTVNGVVFENFSEGGIGNKVSNMTTGTNIIDPIISACAPDLYLFSTANDPNTIATCLPNTLAEINAAYPLSDWILIGPHPFNTSVAIGNGQTSNYDVGSIASNIALRNIAIQNNYTFVDGYTLFTSYTNTFLTGMVTQASTPHLTPQGDHIQEMNVLRVSRLDSLANPAIAMNKNGGLAGPSSVTIPTNLSYYGAAGPANGGLVQNGLFFNPGAQTQTGIWASGTTNLWFVGPSNCYGSACWCIDGNGNWDGNSRVLSAGGFGALGDGGNTRMNVNPGSFTWYTNNGGTTLASLSSSGFNLNVPYSNGSAVGFSGTYGATRSGTAVTVTVTGGIITNVQ